MLTVLAVWVISIHSMMEAKAFELSFKGTQFTVPKGTLISLFEHHPEFINSTSYKAQSSVPLEIFYGR
jgi:hypothetical protein